MGLGRRKVRLDNASGWVFNRIADVYDARPPYPPTLIDALATLAGERGRVVDVGAGIGHLALPLAARGLDVTAIEPAIAMLDRLRGTASATGLTLRALNATAEALPLEAASYELAIIADALHFLDAERAGSELGRVLAPGAACAVVICELAPTPFMRAVLRVMEETAPRRPRMTAQTLTQLTAVAGVMLMQEQTFTDDASVDRDTLERILRSISFIGPAMNATRFAAFRERIHALSDAPVWSRRFTLHAGRKR